MLSGTITDIRRTEAIFVLIALTLSTILSVALNKKYKRGFSLNTLIMLSMIGNIIGFFVGASLENILNMTSKDIISLKDLLISLIFAIIGAVVLDYFSIIRGKLSKEK